MKTITGINNETHCIACGVEFPTPQPGDVATGYALIEIEKKEFRICYKCCADQDRKYMREHGKIMLYLVYTVKQPTESERRIGYRPTKVYEVTNWPGTLRFKVRASKEGHHNIAGKRTDVWFRGPDNKEWWGVNYGDNTQIVHCRRTKQK
jgi:hypothetical protein